MDREPITISGKKLSIYALPEDKQAVYELDSYNVPWCIAIMTDEWWICRWSNLHRYFELMVRVSEPDSLYVDANCWLTLREQVSTDLPDRALTAFITAARSNVQVVKSETRGEMILGGEVKPRTYLIGVTTPLEDGLRDYLRDTGQEAFLDDPDALSGPGLVSFYAKLCYKSLVEGMNSNVKSIRAVRSNLEGVIKSGHGSVLEHFVLNFVSTDVSRVFTHQMVRHRAGFAYSQTSGHFCAIDDARLVVPENLTGEALELAQEHLERTKQVADRMRALMINEGMSMKEKKALTSSIRYILPDGAANELGWSCNWRALRHVIELRTAKDNIWELRFVFGQVADMLMEKYPVLLFGGAKNSDGEWTGLRV